jgi:hypothetical protein
MFIRLIVPHLILLLGLNFSWFCLSILGNWLSSCLPFMNDQLCRLWGEKEAESSEIFLFHEGKLLKVKLLASPNGL